MKLDDYEEFNNEKPDEELDESEENGKGGSTGSKIMIAVIFIAILALGAGAVFFSFQGDDESETGAIQSSIAAVTVKDSGKASESSNASEEEKKEQESDAEGTEITTEFLPDNSKVTAKDVVNLRSMPSVTNENCEILGTLSKGETLQRTGIDYETGWSRLDYNGQTVYAVTSYLDIVK